MKLKCESHDFRAMVLPSAKVIHRKDGTPCGGPYVTMGYCTFTATEVLHFQNKGPGLATIANMSRKAFDAFIEEWDD